MFKVQRVHVVLLMGVCSIFLTGCWPFGATQDTAKPKLIIINVLDKADFDDCHIKDSINITFDEFEAKIPTLSKKNHYVLYCADYMCMSSGFCAKLLLDAKFEHVWAYEGGMAEWFQKGYPIEGPATLEYLTGENINLADDEQGPVPIITAEQLLIKMEAFA